MSTTASPQLGQSAEDYLKCIYTLEAEAGPVSTSNVAQALEVSPAAVTKAVQQLARKKLVRHRPYHGVSLTPKGTRAALDIVRRHRLIELFLHDVLGYGWDEVDAEAERLEHHVSDEFISKLDELLGFPAIDPHGDPIPSSDGELTPLDGKLLADCAVQEQVTILRVCDDDPQALKLLDRLGMRPGKMVEVIDKQPFHGPLTLRIDSADHAVGRELAGFVLVKGVETDEPTSVAKQRGTMTESNV